MKKLALLALATALATAGSAQAAIIYLSTNGTADSNGVAVSPTANPTLTLNVGDTGTLYVLGKRSGTSGSVNSLGLSIAQQSANGGALNATSFQIQNPAGVNLDGDPIHRWQGTPVNGELNAAGGNLVLNSKAVAVSDPAGFYQSLTGALRVHAAFTFTATAPGTINLFLKVGDATISESNATTTSLFGRTADGTADDPSVIQNAGIGTGSAIPDAIITVAGVIPEPASMSLLGLGATALLGRRRRA